MSDLQVLEVATREWNVCDDFDLAITSLADGNGVTELSNTALDLDLVVEELLEGGEIEDLVADWLGAVDGVLVGDLCGLSLL